MTALGIDPKNDFAFKLVFGSEQHTGILVHVLNAVLNPPPGKQVENVEILNPFTFPVALDDKLSILDIRARDQTGRSFNVEMQMIPQSGLRGRLLYYWAKLFGSQLQAGDRYDQLMPTISICFLDGLFVTQPDAYHLSFRLWDLKSGIAFSDHLALHIFQLPRFTKRAEELSDALDLWLYFLNNAKELDPDNLPPSLRVAAVEEAMTLLRRVSQEEYERQLYEDRERARHDAAGRDYQIKMIEQRQAELAQGQAELAQRQAELAQGRAELAEAQKQLLQGQAELAEAQKQLLQGQAELAEAQKQLLLRQAQ